MANPKVLLVDDDESISAVLSVLLEDQGFDVTCANCVGDALKKISAETYDVLLSDLHMPGAGDGLTVVSAMRHSNPNAVTMLLSAFPEMDAAAHAILMQADEILVKPMDASALVGVIRQRLAKEPTPTRVVETVAGILERSVNETIDDWYGHIQTEAVLMAVPMTHEVRCHHLPQLFRDLVNRLRTPKAHDTKELRSAAAAQHGANRRKQGYTASMVVEESRMLQVSIFGTLQKNLANIDFSVVLLGVMTIADEIDAQLSQALSSYDSEAPINALPATDYVAVPAGDVPLIQIAEA